MSSISSNYSGLPDLHPVSNDDLSKYVTNFPAITNLITAPIGIIAGIKDLLSSIKDKDPNGKKNAIFHISSCLIAFTHAAKASFALINEFVHKYASISLVKELVAISGIFLCVIETFIELHGMIKQALFQSKFTTSKDIPILKAETDKALTDFVEESKKIIQKLNLPHKDLLLEKLNNLERSKDLDAAKKIEKKLEASFYLRNFKIIDEKYVKPRDDDKEGKRPRLKTLQKRLQPWLYNEMLEPFQSFNDLKSIIENDHMDLSTLKTTFTRYQTFFDNMRSQSKKAIIIHMIAIASLGITAGSILASFFAIPIAIPFGLTALSFVASTITSILQMGLLPAKGNSIDWDLILPNFIRKKFV